jgi:hypothetical protein
MATPTEGDQNDSKNGHSAVNKLAQTYNYWLSRFVITTYLRHRCYNMSQVVLVCLPLAAVFTSNSRVATIRSAVVRQTPEIHVQQIVILRFVRVFLLGLSHICLR